MISCKDLPYEGETVKLLIWWSKYVSQSFLAFCLLLTSQHKWHKNFTFTISSGLHFQNIINVQGCYFLQVCRYHLKAMWTQGYKGVGTWYNVTKLVTAEPGTKIRYFQLSAFPQCSSVVMTTNAGKKKKKHSRKKNIAKKVYLMHWPVGNWAWN